jgi:hypothetical protein
MPPRHPLLACCNTANQPWICAHCGDAGSDTPTVFLFELCDELCAIHEIVVPPEAVNDILPFLRQVTGIEWFEGRNFVSGSVGSVFSAASCMLVSVYYDETGKESHDRNAGASQILGFEVYGKAVVVCSEDLQGTSDVDGSVNKVWPIEPFLRELQVRGKGVQIYKNKLIAHYGRAGDVLHKIKTTCEQDPSAGIGSITGRNASQVGTVSQA